MNKNKELRESKNQGYVEVKNKVGEEPRKCQGEVGQGYKYAEERKILEESGHLEQWCSMMSYEASEMLGKSLRHS